MHILPSAFIPEHDYQVFHEMLSRISDGLAEEADGDVFTAISRQVVKDMEMEGMNSATKCDVFLMFLCYCSIAQHMELLENNRRFKRFFHTIKKKTAEFKKTSSRFATLIERLKSYGCIDDAF